MDTPKPTVQESLQALRSCVASFETADFDRERFAEAAKWCDSLRESREAVAMLGELRDLGADIEGLLQAFLLYRLHSELIGAAYVEVTTENMLLGGSDMMNVSSLERILADLKAVQRSPMGYTVEEDVRMISECLASVRRREKRIADNPDETVTMRVPDADAPGGHRIARIKPESAFAQPVQLKVQPHPDMAEELRGPGKRGQPDLSVLTIAVFAHMKACRHPEPPAATARLLATVADLEPPEGGDFSPRVDAHRNRLGRALKKEVLVRRATRFGANAGLVMRI